MCSALSDKLCYTEAIEVNLLQIACMKLSKAHKELQISNAIIDCFNQLRRFTNTTWFNSMAGYFQGEISQIPNSTMIHKK